MMLQITLPDELEKWVAESATQEDFGSADAVVVEALRGLRARREAEQARQAELVLEAIEEEGDDIEATPQWWDSFRAELNEKYGAR